MSLTDRLPSLAIALVVAPALLLSAGCAGDSYRLGADHASSDRSPRLAADVAPQKIASGTSHPTSLTQASASPRAEAPSAATGTWVRGGHVPQSSHLRPVSFQQTLQRPPLPEPIERLPPPLPDGEQALPDGNQAPLYREQGSRPEPLPPTPARAADGTRASTADANRVVVSIPPRPPGLVKRLLRFVKGSSAAEHSRQETQVPLSIELQPFSASGQRNAPDRWWTAFGDPALNRQVESSLGGSFTLASALERLRAAQALARREASDLWPDVNGFAETEGTIRTDAPNDTFTALGLDVSYQVDLWGRITSRVEAERLRASATGADYDAVALTLTSEIARAWFTLIEARAQLELLQEQLETNLTGLKLQETRFGGAAEGVGSADVLRQRQLVEATREQMVIARARVDVLEHRLAVLQGRPPQRASYDGGSTLPKLPPLPDTGLPSELLQRRPDVRRDYLALVAADRDLASAISDQYPRLNLGGSLATVADGRANLFQDWVLGLASQLVTPLIDGGQRRAEVDRTAAVLRQLVADYGQTVLTAFQEVEDALALERYQRQRIESLDKQYDLAREASVQLRDRYFRFGEIGDTEYLDVLTAITAEQRLQREILSARLDLILNRIALYLALAGGFEPRPGSLADVGPKPGVPGPGVPASSASPRSNPAQPIPARSSIDERQPEQANRTPLDSGPGLGDPLRGPLGWFGGRHRGDSADRADRAADRGDPQVGGTRRDGRG